jgi:hypothetical protein
MCAYGDIEQPLVGLGPTNVMKTRGFEYETWGVFAVELRGFEPLTPSEGRPYATPRRTSGGSWPNPLDLKHCRGSNHFVDPTLPDNLVASRRLSEVLSVDPWMGWPGDLVSL